MIEVIDATTEHIAELLGLLEGNAMQGDWELIMTRRPGYFSPRDDFGEVYPALARDGDTLVGMCQLTVQTGWVNGEEAQMGYLSSLRIVPKYRNHLKVLQAGFSYLRQLPTPDHCYTSIAENNLLARRLLERGVEGLPLYRHLSNMTTLAINKSRGKNHGLWKLVPPEDYTDVIRFFAQEAESRQLAPALNLKAMQQVGITVLGSYQNGQLVACAMLWDQRAFKQVVVANYSGKMKMLRPVYNAFAGMTRRPQMPAIGDVIPQSFLSFLACTDDRLIPDLIEEAMLFCTTPIMTVGLPSSHICTRDVIARTGASVYCTRIYGVDLTAAPMWDGRIVWPEVALL